MNDDRGQLSGLSSVQGCVNGLDMHINCGGLAFILMVCVFPYKHNTQKVWQTTTSTDFPPLPIKSHLPLFITGRVPLQA